MKESIVYTGIKEGDNNDWAPTVNGYIQTENNLAMVRQMIDGHIKTLPNEVDGYDGLDYWNIIFGKTPMMTKVRAIIESIQTVPTVSQVLFVQGAWSDKESGVLNMAFNISTSMGDLLYQLSINQNTKQVITNFVQSSNN